jgi:hypothetical protein
MLCFEIRASSHSWLEAFCVGCIDFEVLAIGVVIKVPFCVPVDDVLLGREGQEGFATYLTVKEMEKTSRPF